MPTLSSPALPVSVQGLRKQYPGFTLGPVSFTLRPGTVMGFIGRNGAGKTTTLKALLNLVHPDSGEIRFFGREFSTRELSGKQQIGFVSGGINFYPKKKLKTITAVTRRFYPGWDDGAYRRCLSLFGLPEEKTPDQLSEGMKVKYALTLALSHRAEVLLLDEPTSGLDPVSREEILDIFNALVRKEGVSILFSTHIISDLEKCADDVTYIRKGSLLFSGPLEEFRSSYRLVRLPEEKLPEQARSRLLGLKREKQGWSALLKAGEDLAGAEPLEADLESIMVHLEQAEGEDGLL